MSVPLGYQDVLGSLRRHLAAATMEALPAFASEDRLDELEAIDSIRLLEAIALAEAEFGVLIDLDGLEEIETLHDVVELLRRASPAHPRAT